MSEGKDGPPDLKGADHTGFTVLRVGTVATGRRLGRPPDRDQNRGGS